MAGEEVIGDASELRVTGSRRGGLRRIKTGAADEKDEAQRNENSIHVVSVNGEPGA